MIESPIHRAIVAAIYELAAFVMTILIGGGVNSDEADVLEILQSRFPPAQLEKGCGLPKGILVPGGAVTSFVVARSGGGNPSIGAAERVSAAISLAQRYPEAKLVFSGRGEVNPIQILEQSGVPPDRVVVESASEDTAENARLSARLLQPTPGDCWILVTSAAHMPRAMGAFRHQGFNVVAYPVDYRTANVEAAKAISERELLGLFGYWITGRSDALFPAPHEKTCC